MPVSTVLVSSTLTAGGSSGTSGTINIPDYTDLLDRIAIALENISTQSTTLVTNSTTIANNLTAIATDIDTMASNSTTIKNAIDNSPPTTATFTGTISDGLGGSGTILTVSGVSSGIISTGMRIVGGSVLSDTFITDGSGTTWSVSQSQNVSSSSLVGFSITGYLTSLISNISSKQTAIETYQKKLKELGEGSGIRMIGPYEIFGMISLYRLMIEQAKALDTTDKVSASTQAAALAEVARVSNLIKDNIPREF